MTVSASARPGSLFTRSAISLLLARGNHKLAAEIARNRFGDTPAVQLYHEKAIGAVTTTNSPELMPPGLTEILALVRPRTIIGKMQVRRVPLNRAVAAQLGTATFAWIGEGRGFPVGHLTWRGASLPPRKAGGILVVSEELLAMTGPAAEAAIREELTRGLVEFEDVAFMDPAAAEVPDESPASITFNAATTPASGSDAQAARADLIRLIQDANDALGTLEGGVLIMSDGNAFALGAMLTPSGSSLFPDVGARGGSLWGVPVVVSASAGDVIAFAHAPSILLGDDGEIAIDVASDATLEMLADPAGDSVTPTAMASHAVSMFQTNSRALRVKRFINWEAGPGAVYVISGAAYGASSESS